MVDTLIEGSDLCGCTAVRACYGAAHTRTDEPLRLVDPARRASMDLVVKVDGCEASRNKTRGTL